MGTAGDGLGNNGWGVEEEFKTQIIMVISLKQEGLRMQEGLAKVALGPLLWARVFTKVKHVSSTVPKKQAA